MSDPNVVIICCDDLGYGDLGCYGAEYETPNVDSLAADGTRFTDWHSNAPVCSPTRASLLTGCYPHRVGVPGNAPQGRPETDPELGLPPDQTTIADTLSDNGYRTGAFGKWHLGMTERDDPLAHGFEEHFGFYSGCVDYYSHLMIWLQGNGVPPYHDLWKNRQEVWHNGEYLTELITESTVNFIEDAASDADPFFTYVAYNAPHYPIHAPEEYVERFDHIEDEERRVHAAMVAAVDDGVGAITDTLEREGVGENTILVFTSDHGPSREVRNHLDGSLKPYHGGRTGGHRGHKFSLFEGGIKVPCLVHYPAELDGGQVTDELGVSMDLFPTVLDLCGIDSPNDFDGESLRGVLEGSGTTPHDRVFWESNSQIAVRDGDWKLVLDAQEADPDPDAAHLTRTTEEFLTDLDADPFESSNLADEYPERVEELAGLAREWLDQVTEATTGSGVET